MNIVITGASGLLGTELINQLQNTEHNIFALTSNKEALIEKWNEKIQINTIEEWENGKFSFEGKDVVIHCAFARAHKGGEEIAKALFFTKKLFEDLKNKNVASLINISTQEVYGKKTSPWKEKSGVEPNTTYGTAKYFTELLANEFVSQSSSSTNIRLAGLLSVDTSSRMVNKFVDNVLNNEPIKILDGKLVFSQLDVRDAASGIIELLKVSSEKWKLSYNLGFTQSYSIQEIADSVKEVAKSYKKDIEIIKQNSDVVIDAELDSCTLYNQIGWKPKYDMKSIVKSIFEYKLSVNDGAK